MNAQRRAGNRGRKGARVSIVVEPVTPSGNARAVVRSDTEKVGTWVNLTLRGATENSFVANRGRLGSDDLATHLSKMMAQYETQAHDRALRLTGGKITVLGRKKKNKLLSKIWP